MHPKRFLILAALVVILTAAPASAGLFGRRGLRSNGCPNCQTQAQVLPQARVTQLPDDSAFGYATIMVHEDWATRPEEAALVTTWQAMPEVQAVVNTGHYLVYTDKDAMYRDRLKATNPILPAIMLQTADGRITFKDHGEATPAQVERPIILPWRRNHAVPTPEPTPDVTPKPDVNTVVAPLPIPDKVPIEKPKTLSGLSGWVVATLILVGAGICIVVFYVIGKN